MNNIWQIIKKPITGLAPMDGVTDEPMRQVQCLVAKPDVMYTEFISVEGFQRNRNAFSRKLFFKENERPIVTQVFGYTPEAFYKTVLEVSKLGFDGIDINMGCPAKGVLKKGGGGALIGDCQLAEKIIEESLKAIKDSGKDIPLSVKTRIGKNEIITKDWISFLCRFPIAEITIHGRLLKEGNNGPVNWEEIQKAAEIARPKGIICLGNGGVKFYQEAREKAEKYGLDGVLIGQAACGNPWVFSENILPTQDLILKTIIQHAELVSEFYDERGFVSILKHFSWYPKEFKNCKKLKIELLKTRNLREVQQIIKKFKNNY